MKTIKKFLTEITPTAIKLLITIATISLFCWLSAECYREETFWPIILVWLGVAIFLNIVWKYKRRPVEVAMVEIVDILNIKNRVSGGNNTRISK